MGTVTKLATTLPATGMEETASVTKSTPSSLTLREADSFSLTFNIFPLLWQVERATVGLWQVSVEELVDRCGSFQVVLEVLAGHLIVIKVVPTPGWQTSSVTKPAMFSLAVLMWETVVKVN